MKSQEDLLMIRTALLTFGCIMIMNFIVPVCCLKCQECSISISKYNGMIGDDSADVKECVEKECGEDESMKCVSGYANFLYTGKISDEATVGELDINMNYFKGCGIAPYTSCEALEDMMSLYTQYDENGKIEVKSCGIEDCDSDNCNDIKPEDINPAGALESISCYSCEKTTVDGGEEEDNRNHECSTESVVECTLGVTSCMSGNAEATINDKIYITDYRKGCGENIYSSCDAMEQYVKDLNGEPKSCSSHVCEGELCNTQTAEETKKLTGSSKSFRPRMDVAVFIVALGSVLALWSSIY